MKTFNEILNEVDESTSRDAMTLLEAHDFLERMIHELQLRLGAVRIEMRVAEKKKP